MAESDATMPGSDVRDVVAAMMSFNDRSEPPVGPRKFQSTCGPRKAFNEAATEFARPGRARTHESASQEWAHVTAAVRPHKLHKTGSSSERGADRCASDVGTIAFRGGKSDSGTNFSSGSDSAEYVDAGGGWRLPSLKSLLPSQSTWVGSVGGAAQQQPTASLAAHNAVSRNRHRLFATLHRAKAAHLHPVPGVLALELPQSGARRVAGRER